MFEKVHRRVFPRSQTRYHVSLYDLTCRQPCVCLAAVHSFIWWNHSVMNSVKLLLFVVRSPGAYGGGLVWFCVGGWCVLGFSGWGKRDRKTTTIGPWKMQIVAGEQKRSKSSSKWRESKYFASELGIVQLRRIMWVPISALHRWIMFYQLALAY